MPHTLASFVIICVVLGFLTFVLIRSVTCNHIMVSVSFAIIYISLFVNSLSGYAWALFQSFLSQSTYLISLLEVWYQFYQLTIFAYSTFRYLIPENGWMSIIRRNGIALVRKQFNYSNQFMFINNFYVLIIIKAIDSCFKLMFGWRYF